MLTITLNAAQDLTYRVAELRPGTSHPVTSVRAQAGGKGINVARVLARLGHEVTVTGLVAGPVGDEIRRDLAAAGLRDRLLPRRRRVTSHGHRRRRARRRRTGDRPQRAGWRSAVRLARRRAPARGAHGRRAVVVASGSLPAAAPRDVYARLTRLAHERGARIIVDTTGDALLAAAAAGADVVKPNIDELLAATGCADADAGVEQLRKLGAHAVAVSLGPDGLLLVRDGETARCRPPAFVPGNPTGAGDATVAALALALRDDLPFGEAARTAVALSAAAVAHPLAGHVDEEVFRAFLALETGDPSTEERT